MKTYAAIPINIKDMDDGTHIRRVLISFEDVKVELYHGWPMRFFSGTKLLAKDPYFESEESSHKYLFEDDGYTLLNVDANNPNRDRYNKEALDIYDKRRYHLCTNSLTSEQIEQSMIEAESDEEAIKLFNEREELR